MENKVLMSIMTKYSNKIFNGTKLWEFRKNLPNMLEEEKSTVVVYSSKEEKAIVGEFKVGRILKCSFHELMKITGCEDDEKAVNWFKQYYKDKELCCAIEVKEPFRYNTQISLREIQKEIPNFRAPQNFLYMIDGGDLDKILSVYMKRGDKHVKNC